MQRGGGKSHTAKVASGGRGRVERHAPGLAGKSGADDFRPAQRFAILLVMKNDLSALEIFLIHAAGKIKFRRLPAPHDKSGMVHVRHEPKRFAVVGFVFIAGVKIAEFIQMHGQVRQAGQLLEQAGANMTLVARRGRAAGQRQFRPGKVPRPGCAFLGRMPPGPPAAREREVHFLIRDARTARLKMPPTTQSETSVDTGKNASPTIFAPMKTSTPASPKWRNSRCRRAPASRRIERTQAENRADVRGGRR